MGNANSSSSLKKNVSINSISSSTGRMRFDSPALSTASAKQRARRRRLDAGADHSPQTGGGIPHASSLSSLQRETTPLVQVTPNLGGTFDHGKKIPMESDYSFGDGIPIKSPPLLIWIWPALLCALAYALYNIFIKKGSSSIHPVLGGVILQIVAAILGTFLLIFIVAQDGMETLEFDRSGINWSILAGVAVGSAEMLSFFVMGMGVQATQAVPIVIGGSVMFGCILGAVWLHEILSLQGWIGVLLLVIGIAMVATDPASGLGEGH